METNMRLRRTLAGCAIIGAALGCTSIAAVTNLRDQPCQQNSAMALSEILLAEGEEPARVQKIVDKADLLGSAFDYGPRPFVVSSQSGTDHSFFVEKKGEKCTAVQDTLAPLDPSRVNCAC